MATFETLAASSTFSVSSDVSDRYKGKIKEQLKFYLSEENIVKDLYMQRIMGGHSGWMPIENFLKFNFLKICFNSLRVYGQEARIAVLLEIAEASLSDFKLSSDKTKIQRST